MFYDNLADIVMVFHAAMIVSVFLGILFSVRYKRFRPLESIILLSAIVIWSLYGGCPLTYAENYLRISAGNPLPLVDVGFISFYLNNWFGLMMTDHTVVLITYVIVAVFFAISIEWLSPYLNIEIVKLRKYLGIKYKA
jgi:Protein of Unknown function (DUF2784)